MNCECFGWCFDPVVQPDFKLGHHHYNCEKYKTEKFPRLMYYEEALSYWTPVPDKVEHLLVVADQLEDGEKMEIEFRRVDMTDHEYNSIPID